MAKSSEQPFESVLSWLYAERDKYQTSKFDYNNEPTDTDYWIQQFDSYIQRLPLFGLDTPQGIQAACKLAATVVALCEHLAAEHGLPKPGVPSGTIEEWQ